MSTSRRELLRWLLGAPLVAGCQRFDGLRLPPSGEIVGPAVARGHQLRDAASPPRPAADAWQTTGVVVVGGGVAGLSAAWRMVEQGRRDFVLLELEAELGGAARSGQSELTAFPWGAHYLPAPERTNVDLLRLLEQAGAVEGYSPGGEPVFAEQHLCRDPQERIFYKGRWYEGLYLLAGATDEDRRQLARFSTEVARWSLFRDGQGRPAFAIPTSRCSDDAEVVALDRLSMADWLDQQRLTSPRLRWWIDYACRDDYGLRAADASAWAGLFYFAARSAGAAAASGGALDPTRSPPGPGSDEPNPRSADDARPLLTWPEGNGRLVAQLRAAAPAQIVTGSLVVEVRAVDQHRDDSSADRLRAAGAAPKCEVVAIDARGRCVGYRADAVIFAAPQYVSRHVVRGYAERADAADAPGNAPGAGAMDYGPWLVANLHLRGRPRDLGFPLAWDNVLYESPSLGYVVATHQRGPEHGPTVLTYYYPFCDVDSRAARELLWQMDWPDCAELCLADLRIAHAEIDALTERLDVFRWGHAMIRPRTGSVWGACRRTPKQWGPVHFANTDLSGVALFEEAFDHGIRAADAVRTISA